MSGIDHIIGEEAAALISHSFTAREKANRDTGLEMVGFVLAEGASMVTSLGVVGVADLVAPKTLDSAAHMLSKNFVLPNLDRIEDGLGKVCKLEECQKDESKSREERALDLSKTMIVFSASWAAGMATKLGTRRGANSLFGIHEELPQKQHGIVNKLNPLNLLKMSRKELAIFSADEGVHYGSMLVMNTGAAGVTDEMIRTSTNILTQMGMSKKKAHEISSMAMIWEAPNFLGLLAGLGAVYGTSRHPGSFGIHK